MLILVTLQESELSCTTLPASLCIRVQQKGSPGLVVRDDDSNSNPGAVYWMDILLDSF